jgi:hypothetical protein
MMIKKKPAAAKKFSRAAARPPAAAAARPPLEASIDYPAEGERVLPGHYAVRMTAGGASQAQARLDGGPWRDCRPAVGHFWLDWAPEAGPAVIEARARAGKGRWTSAPPRACVVEG